MYIITVKIFTVTKYLITKLQNIYNKNLTQNQK